MASSIDVRLVRTRRYRSGAHRKSSKLPQPVCEANHAADTLHKNRRVYGVGMNFHCWKRAYYGASRRFVQESRRSIVREDSRGTVSYVSSCKMVPVGCCNFVPFIRSVFFRHMSSRSSMILLCAISLRLVTLIYLHCIILELHYISKSLKVCINGVYIRTEKSLHQTRSSHCHHFFNPSPQLFCNPHTNI